MTREEFDADWVHRIGPTGADELWRRCKRNKFYVLAPVFAGGASIFLGAGAYGVLGDLGGAALVAIVVGLIADFINGIRRLKRELSEWFGTRVDGLPPMNVRAFDRWSTHHGYKHSAEQATS